MSTTSKYQRPRSSTYENRLISVINKSGLIDCKKITNTLQGSIWKALEPNTNTNVVIKVTNRSLHDQSIIVVNRHKYISYENIIKEKSILKYLTMDINAPKSITKYVAFFQSHANYYLVMEDAGKPLFEFVVKAHQFIKAGKIDIYDWHQAVKIIFKQMIECIDYMHSKNVVHFDISLENFLINDINIKITTDDKLKFCMEDIQIKICDFGLSEIFTKNATFRSNKFCGKPNYKSPKVKKQQTFNAKSNDIWCVGICLFMLLIGGSPWFKASDSDRRFAKFMKPNGFKNLLTKWNKNDLVNDDWINLLESILQSEHKRATIDDIKSSPFLQR